MSRPTHEEIARRAYDLYVSRGQVHGNDLRDWLEAELQVVTATQARDIEPRATRGRALKSKTRR